MRALAYRLDRRSLETIYTSFIRPKIEYGSTLYSGAPNCHLIKLDNLEIEILRLICGATKGCSRKRILQEMNWEDLESRRTTKTLCYLYQIRQGNCPVYRILSDRILLTEYYPTSYPATNIILETRQPIDQFFEKLPLPKETFLIFL
jgi:hypothetical protein